MIRGYQKFHAEAGQRIAGIIINQVSEAGFRYLQVLVEKHCAVPVLGYLPVLAGCQLESRHLGLVPAAEDPELDAKLDRLGQQVVETINLSALLELAATAKPLQAAAEVLPANNPVCRIGVARDLAFNFYYADNLDLLRNQGAELVYFSPLADQQLPLDLDGLYFGGGYPEIFAGELSANSSLRQQIRELVLKGLPTVAECGGFLYLGETLRDQAGKCHPMCGVVPSQCRDDRPFAAFWLSDINLDERRFARPTWRSGPRPRIPLFHQQRLWPGLPVHKTVRPLPKDGLPQRYRMARLSSPAFP